MSEPQQATNSFMTADMTEKSNVTTHTNQSNQIKPNNFHETFCKTEKDEKGLTKFPLK